MEKSPLFDAGKALELFAAAHDLAVSAKEKSESFHEMMHLTLEHLTVQKDSPGLRHATGIEVQEVEVAREEERKDPLLWKSPSPRSRLSRGDFSPGFDRRSAWRAYWR